MLTGCASRRLWQSAKRNARLARFSWYRGLRGQNRRENGRDIIRWCFADLVTPASFQKEFGDNSVR